MLLKKLYIPGYLRGNSIVLLDDYISVSIEYKNDTSGTLLVDKCMFYDTDLPLKECVNWKIKDNYLYFFSNSNPQD